LVVYGCSAHVTCITAIGLNLKKLTNLTNDEAENFSRKSFHVWLQEPSATALVFVVQAQHLNGFLNLASFGRFSRLLRTWPSGVAAAEPPEAHVTRRVLDYSVPLQNPQHARHLHHPRPTSFPLC
jgi:hypothetical protein